MTFAPVNTQSSYLPVEFTIPKEEGKFEDFLTKRERLTASIVNIKENGSYQNFELLTAQQWFTTDLTLNTPRYTFRTVVDFGALPSTSTKSVSHNITVDNNTIFTRIFATATNPNAAPGTTQFIPIPYINTGTPGDSVEIWVDNTNVNIKTTTANYAAFTICYVVLEYIKS